MRPDRIIVACLALVFFSRPSVGQTSSWTFSDFSTTVARAGFKFPAASPEHASLESIHASLGDMEGRYLAHFNPGSDTPERIASNLSPEFVASMADDRQAFDDLPADPADRQRALSAIASDLSAKDKYISSLSGLAETSFPTIISVHFVLKISSQSTLRPSNLSVRRNGCVYGTRPPGFVLGNGSGPFDVKIPPGCFTVWVQAGDSIVHVQTEEIGKDQKLSQKVPIDLLFRQGFVTPRSGIATFAASGWLKQEVIPMYRLAISTQRTY
jgi:hypothetical protein